MIHYRRRAILQASVPLKNPTHPIPYNQPLRPTQSRPTATTIDTLPPEGPPASFSAVLAHSLVNVAILLPKNAVRGVVSFEACLNVSLMLQTQDHVHELGLNLD